MGMTIDKHIEVLKSYHHGFTGYAGNLQDSINIAINTMRKYQKIEKLIASWELGLIDNIGYEISEVIEDGKIN